jgi:hypothetical protein
MSGNNIGANISEGGDGREHLCLWHGMAWHGMAWHDTNNLESIGISNER